MSRVGHTAHCIANTYATYFQQCICGKYVDDASTPARGRRWGVGWGGQECAEAMVWGSKIVMEMGKQEMEGSETKSAAMGWWRWAACAEDREAGN